MTEIKGWQLPVFILAVINALTILLATLLMNPTDDSSGFEGSSHDDAILELSQAVQALSEKLESSATARASNVRRSTSLTTKNNSDQSSDSSEALIKSLDALRAQIAGLSQSSGASTAFVPATDEVGITNLATLQSKSWKELSKQHHFWSVDRIVKTYGKPNEMYVAQDGALHINYYDASQKKSYSFKFHDGFVVSVIL